MQSTCLHQVARRLVILPATVFVLLAPHQVTAQSVPETPIDMLLSEGEIYLGDGSDPFIGYVAVAGDRIVSVGRERPDGEVLQTINCSGLVVCPGFIDLHNHSDGEIEKPSTRMAMNYLTQGCTTIVTGNCGSGPVDAQAYYDLVDSHGAGVNVVHLLPQGSLRRQVIGSEQRPASDQELDQMRRLADKAMSDGVWGMSTGLIYVPSSYADLDELVAIATVVGRSGGIYASHIRNEGRGLLDAVEEALEIGRRAEMPVHISHFKSSGQDSWGLVRTAIEMIDKARADGQVVTADQYPYTASSTSLAATCIPAWARSGGRKQTLARIAAGDSKSDEIRRAIRRKLEITDNGHRIQIASCTENPQWAGRRLDEIARELNIDTFELVLQIERGGGAAVVNHSINEGDVRYVMQQDWVATASDGSAKLPDASVPHPRNYGTFPRRIGYYANREKVISLSHAIYSSTGLPAKILGMDDRGMIEKGRYADLVVLDRGRFIDRSTFVAPHQYSEGLVHVLISGKPAVVDGKPTGALLGRALRKPTAK